MTPTPSEFNFFDITVLSIVGFSTLMAFLRGFFKTTFSFCALAGSAALAFFLFSPVKSLLTPYISSKILLLIASSGGLFIALLILFAIVNHYLLEALSEYRFGLVDRGFGFMIGFLRGFAIVLIGFYSIHMTFMALNSGAKPGEAEPKWFSGAKTYPLLMNASEIVVSVMPDDTPKKMLKLVENVRHNVPSAMQSAQKINLMPEGLSADNSEYLRALITAMPEDELAAVFNEYGEQSKLSNDKRLQAYRAVVARYKELALRGEISTSQRVNDEAISSLELALNMRDESPNSDNSELTKKLFGAEQNSEPSLDDVQQKAPSLKDKKEFERLVETIQ